MATSAAARATWEDLLDYGDEVPAEILAGVVVGGPPPAPRQAGPVRALAGTLSTCAGWSVLVGVAVRLAKYDIVRPDLAAWHRERLSEPGEPPIDVVPDWVCEVTSPWTAARDRRDKRTLYARSRIPYYWIVDPDARTLEAMRLEEGRWVHLGTWGASDRARIAPFERVELELGRLFPTSDGT
jgi:hypothetical protein